MIIVVCDCEELHAIICFMCYTELCWSTTTILIFSIYQFIRYSIFICHLLILEDHAKVVIVICSNVTFCVFIITY